MTVVDGIFRNEQDRLDHVRIEFVKRLGLIAEKGPAFGEVMVEMMERVRADRSIVDCGFVGIALCTPDTDFMGLGYKREPNFSAFAGPERVWTRSSISTLSVVHVVSTPLYDVIRYTELWKFITPPYEGRVPFKRLNEGK